MSDLKIDYTNRIKRRFSTQDKRTYCSAWKKSELRQLEFCKVNKISCSSLKRWLKEFKAEEDFVILKEKPGVLQQEHISVEIRLPNQLQLCMAIQKHQLFFLIQELSHASTIIR
jgi:hypothetical protein